MSSRQINAMMRDPKKLMRFQMTGKPPSVSSAPRTPLLALIEQIPMSYWGQFQGVKLSPALGFRSNMQFNTLHQLARWLGHNKQLVDNQRMPYQSYIDHRFRGQVTLAMLVDASASHPPETSTLFKHHRFLA